MKNKAFFFQGDTLLLPKDFPDTQINRGVSLELAKVFESPDIFEAPAIDGTETASPISIVSVLPDVPLPDNWRGIPVRQILTMMSLSAESPDKILRACHIAQWYRESRFCGSCGAENIYVSHEPQRKCPKCGRVEYPRICPAVIVIITDEKNRILLAHNKKFKAGVYSHISGFNEAGETLESTVVREVREEVSIEIKNIEYIKSQSWPFPNSLMLGFKACFLSGTIKPDGVEILDAAWFTKDNLPELPAEGSLSRFLINSWLETAF